MSQVRFGNRLGAAELRRVGDAQLLHIEAPFRLRIHPLQQRPVACRGLRVRLHKQGRHWAAHVEARNCPGQKPPFSAVKRPARPYKSPIQNGLS
jgi:hypothetical protein